MLKLHFSTRRFDAARFFFFTLLFLLAGFVFAAQLPSVKSAVENANLKSIQTSEIVALNQAKTISPNLSTSPTPEMPHNVVAAFYDVQNFPTARLLLNNKGLTPIEVRPTLYNLDGAAMEIAPVFVEANSHRFINLSDWTNSGGESFKRGSLKLFHTGKDLVLGSQIYLEDEANSLSFEERLTELGKFDSRRLEGIWLMPRNETEVTIILSNTSNQMISITANLSKEPHQTGATHTFLLLPHQTRVLDLRDDFTDGNQFADGEIVGLSLEHTGEKSALKAHGQIKDAPKGYSNIISFSNPNTGKSSELHGAGLHLGTIGGDYIEPFVAVKNVGTERANVTAKVPYTRTDGTTGTVDINSINLKAGEMRLLNMNPAIQRGRQEQIEIAGIEIEYDTAPGSVIVSAQSISENLRLNFRIPMGDPYALSSSTGGYPWRIEETSTTFAYIKNTTDSEQEYVAMLTWEGGEYMIGLKKIAPRQTIQIDAKKLRDNQTPDERGITIPPNIDSGQIKWTIRSEEYLPEQTLRKSALTGRSEQIDTVNGVTSSYACHNCCTKRANGWISSGGITEAEVGDQIQFVAYEENWDCYNAYYPPHLIPNSNVDWDSSNDNIATVNNGLVTIVGVGEFEIDGDWMVIVTTDQGGACGPYLTGKEEKSSVREVSEQNFVPDCNECQTGEVPIDSDIEITAKPKVTIPSMTAIPKGSERVVQITNASNASITLTLTTHEGTGSATFSNGSNTMTINSTQDVTLKGVTESSKKDNIKLKATWTENNRTYTLDDEEFCVLWVTLTLRTTGAVATDNSARPNYVTRLGTDDLKTFLSNGVGSEHLWRTGIELMGVTSPSNFDGLIVLKRAIIGKSRFHDQTRINYTFNSPDTSDALFRDDDPQSGGSGGKVYDLDAPGMRVGDGTITDPRPIGFILRDRTNFRQWASFTDGQTEMKVSANLEWFSRLSVTKQRSGSDNLNTDVANDNKAGLGTTNLSWDLSVISPLSEGENNMKKTIPLIVALAATSLCENPTLIYSQTTTDKCVSIKKDEETEKLLAVIRDKSLIKTDSAKVIAAIDKLGELKAVEAIDDLAQLLTLDRGAKYFDTENPPSGGIISSYAVYPAVKALTSIGMPSIPALTKVIENEKSDSRASINAWLIIVDLYRDNPQEAVSLLNKAAGAAANQDGAVRLFDAARRFEELIQKLKQ